jgi:TonB family protein
VTAPGNILVQSEPVRGGFLGALTLHLALLGGIVFSNYLANHRDTFGERNAGGAAVPIEVANTIPLAHNGPQNPLASDTQSEVPQALTKPIERVKADTPPPDAIPIKSHTPKKPAAEQPSERNRFRSFKELDPYQATSKSPPVVSSPAFSASGAGNISLGPRTTLGDNFSAYGAQLQQLVASHWRTDTVDSRVRTAPIIIVDFDVMRDGSVRNIHILQGSGIAPLDSSVERAIRDTSLPPLPLGFPHDRASVESWFELKR